MSAIMINCVGRRALAGGYILLAIILSSGCTSEDRSGKVIVSPTVPQPGNAPIIEVVSESGRAVAVRQQNGDEILFQRGEAVIGDWIAIDLGDQGVEVHRTPAAIMRESSRLPHLYLDPETKERFVTEGQQGSLYVHPKTNRICWPALTCGNPDCPSREDSRQPYVFVVELIPGTRVESGGRFVAPPSNPQASGVSIVPNCPRCGTRAFVKRHQLAEEIQGAEALKVELDRVRDARDRAAP